MLGGDAGIARLFHKIFRINSLAGVIQGGTFALTSEKKKRIL